MYECDGANPPVRALYLPGLVLPPMMFGAKNASLCVSISVRTTPVLSYVENGDRR